MKIAAIDSGYININNYYIFKGAILYYIYENNVLIDKELKIEITNLIEINNMYKVNLYRTELETKLANNTNADIVLLDGRLDDIFYNKITVKKSRYWIPKKIIRDEDLEQNDKIIYKIIGEKKKYKIETFVENQDYFDKDFEIIKSYLTSKDIDYPFILYEVDKLAKIGISDIGEKYKEVLELKFNELIHERMLRNDKDLKI